MLQRDIIEKPAGWTYASTFAASALAALVPLWSVGYPPMVDLPQHAAQVFLWQHYDDPAYGLEALYRIELFKPYFLGYALTRLFAEFVGVLAGLKIVISLYLLGLPLSIDRLLAVTGSQRWGALLGFPLAYGFAFHWGFFNFLIALPFAFLFLALGWKEAEEPRLRRGVGLGVFAFVLYFCHAVAFGFCMAVLGLVMLASATSLRSALRRLAPLVPAGVSFLLWLVTFGRGDSRAGGPAQWTELPWQRLVELPGLLLGGAIGSGSTPPVYRLGGLAVLLLPFVLARLGRPPWVLEGSQRRQALRRLLPLAVALAFYFLAPNRLLGTWFLYPRMALFVAVTLLLLFPAGEGPRSRLRRWGPVLVTVFVFAWMAWLSVEFRAFEREAAGMEVVLDEMEPHRKVVGLIADRGYDLVAGLPIFGHFHAWYSAEKGGMAESSFASAYPQYLVQYRDPPRTRHLLSMRPDLFEWRLDGGVDYFLVRAERDLGPYLFHDADAPVRLLARSGDWWVYEKMEPPSPSPSPSSP